MGTSPDNGLMAFVLVDLFNWTRPLCYVVPMAVSLALTALYRGRIVSAINLANIFFPYIVLIGLVLHDAFDPVARAKIWSGMGEGIFVMTMINLIWGACALVGSFIAKVTMALWLRRAN